VVLEAKAAAMKQVLSDDSDMGRSRVEEFDRGLSVKVPDQGCLSCTELLNKPDDIALYEVQHSDIDTSDSLLAREPASLTAEKKASPGVFTSHASLRWEVMHYSQIGDLG